LVFDCSEYGAAKEEGEAPIESPGVGSGESIGYTDGDVAGQSVGVGDGELERSACAVGALIGCGKSLCGGWAVPEGEVGAGGKARGGCIQEIDGVRTGVQESGVGEGGVVESGGDISCGWIEGIDGSAA